MGTQTNPYVGPRAFAAGERLFGRDRELADLVDLVIAERIVLLHAPSGAGKSSLLQAGLAPRLRAEGLVVLPVARVGTPPPIECPDRFTLSVLLGLEEDVPKARQTPLATLAGLRLADYLDRRRGDGESDVLILDQFEELLTIDPANRAAKLAFLRELGTALRRDDRYAVLALREDWLAALQAFRDLLPTRLRASYRLDMLAPAAALAAVQGPAAAMQVRFSDAAAGKLIDDLRQVRTLAADGSVTLEPGPCVEPVQLQVTCRTLWSRLSPGTVEIQPADLAAIGDVDQALAAYFDDELAAVARTTDVPERLVRTWLARNLVTERGLRTQILRGPNDTAGLSERTLAALVDTHLVRADERRGMTWYELAHDRLVAPLLASNARHAAAHLGPLERQAELWDSQDRPESLLLADPELLDRAAAETHARTPAELAFLAACQQLRLRRARDRRTARFMAGLAVLACAGLVVAIGAARMARRSAADASHMRDKAEEQRKRAEAARQLALSRQLGAQAQTLPLVDYELAALLAVEASARAPAIEARAPLLSLAARWPRMQGLLDIGSETLSGITVDPQDGAAHVLLSGLGARVYGRARAPTRTHGEPIEALGFATTGPLYASTSDARVQLRDRRDGAVTRELGRPFPPGERVEAVALAPDATVLVVASDAGTLVAFDVADGRERWRVSDPPGRRAVVVTAEAAFVAQATGITRHDLADGHPVSTIDLAIDRVASWPGRDVVAILPPPRETGYGLFTDPPQLVELTTATVHAPVDRQPATFTALALHPTGFDIAASLCDGDCRTVDLRIWNGRTGQLQLRSTLGTVRPDALAYTTDGETIIVGGFEHIHRHDVRLRPRVDVSTSAAAFTADGHLITGDTDGLSRWTLDPLRRVDTVRLPIIVAGLQLAADQRRVAIVSDDGQARAYDLETRTNLFVTPPPQPISRASIGELADGRFAVVGQEESGAVVAWDAATGAMFGRQALADPGVGVSWPEWSGGRVLTSNCQRMRLSCDEWRLWVWDPLHPDVAPLQPLPALTGQIDDFDTSPDGASLVAIAGGTLARWTLPDLEPRMRQRSDARWGGSVVHGRGDGFLVATAQCGATDCEGPSLRLFDATSLQPIGAPQVDLDGTTLRLLAAGREHALVRSEIATVLWDLRLVQLQRDACRLAARELTVDEWQHYLDDLPYRAICSQLAATATKPP